MARKEKRQKKLKLKSKYRVHRSFNLRLTFDLLIFVLSFIFCLYYATKSFEYRNAKYVNYNDKNIIDYKVYVKENDFYETDYLNKGMIYVSGLIDKINIDFNYLFDIDEKMDMNFKYRILANLVIANSDNNAKYFEKDYVLLDDKEVKMTDDDNYNISEEINIDYDYYNKLAVDYKSSYGLDTKSYLKVYMQIEKNSLKENININDSTESSITIPLSERSVQIKFDANDVIKSNQVIANKELIFRQDNFIIEVILFIISVIFISKTIKLSTLLIKKKSDYDIYLNKILKEYDRLIVETTTGIDFKNNHIIKITKFTELLDVRDNLKLPIMYYNIVNHQKSYFYIKNKNDVYLFQIKASDMGN